MTEFLKWIKLNDNDYQNRKEVSIMPGFDGTGPLGQGSMTGGGFGVCGVDSGEQNQNDPITNKPAYGRGLGLARGNGFGRGLRGGRRGFVKQNISNSENNPEILQENENLKKKITTLESKLNSLEAKIEKNNKLEEK
ncbi:MAG: DUF5320 domain-containing protein [Candidatus Muiribacteriota bacterium]